MVTCARKLRSLNFFSLSVLLLLPFFLLSHFPLGLPSFARGPTIKTLARLGARWQQYQKSSAAAAAADAAEKRAADGEEEEEPPGYASAELDLVEKQIRRAVIGRFGIPVRHSTERCIRSEGRNFSPHVADSFACVFSAAIVPFCFLCYYYFSLFFPF